MSLIRVVLIVLALFIVSCTSDKPKNKKTFVFCSEGSPSTFNPQLGVDGATFNASAKPIYSRLVEFKRGTTEILPSLAESWEISNDELNYTFKLRKGVKYHTTSYFTPTREFNADDVIFTFNRQRLDSHPYNKINGGLYEYFKSMEMDKIITDIVKLDDYTVKFVLSRKEAPFLANLGMDFASILSKEYGDTLLKKGKAEKMDIEPVGTGPFVFKRYIKDTLVRYTAHPDYFLGVASIKKLVFAITPDASVRYQKLKTEECHFINEPSPVDLKDMQNNPDIKLVSKAGMNIGYLAFNTEKKPFNNLLVRKAIYHAINKESYIEAIYQGFAEPAVAPMPPSIWGYNSELKKYKYDVEKSKELLKKAGFAKGFETTLWTLPVSRPYNPNGKKMGELMQADLAKVGIKVNLVSYDWPTYLTKTSKGEHDMAQFGWTGDNGDPDNFLNVLLSCEAIEPGMNRARWCNKAYSELTLKAKKTSDVAQRVKLYKQAQSIFNNEVPWVPIVHSKVFKAMSKNIEGYVLSPMGTEDFYPIKLK